MALRKFLKISRYSSEFSLRLAEKIKNFVTKIFAQRDYMRLFAIIFILCAPSLASATVFINEIQISPIKERFIELYNPDSFDVDLSGWYIQRKTATGSSFGSLVASTQFAGKVVKAQSYFLISRSQLYNSDVVADLTLTESNTVRIRDSKGKDVNQIEWGTIGEVKSYQRASSGIWTEGAPTPGATNTTPQNPSIASPTSTTNTTSVAPQTAAPQVVAQAGPQTRVVLAGAPIMFEGKISGLENTYGSVTNTTWSFGDGASAEGETVTHTYYYPGEYTAILSITSGNLIATDKMLVRVVLPNLSVSTGGDTSRSFFLVKNESADDLDISGWQVLALGKTFTFPKNTILSARKSATFASEVTGLTTPSGSIPKFQFSNGSPVEIKSEIKNEPTMMKEVSPKVVQDTKIKTVAQERVVSQASPIVPPQQAAVADAFSDTQEPVVTEGEGGMWPWYVGVAFLGALSLLALRFVQGGEVKTTISAEDFEIIEETDDGEPH